MNWILASMSQLLRSGRVLGIAIATMAIATGGVLWAFHVTSPSLHLDRSVIDLGNVQAGSTVSGVVKFTNSGGGVLQIQAIKTSCSCTAAKMSETALPSGKTGEISFVVQVPADQTSLQAFIALDSNAVNASEGSITISGVVTAAVSISPRIVDFGSLRRAQLPVEKVVDITQMDASMHTLLGSELRENWPGIQVRLMEGSKKEHYRIAVTLDSSCPDGAFQNELGIFSSDGTHKLKVPIAGKIIGTASATPEYVMFGIGKDSARFKSVTLHGVGEDLGWEVFPLSMREYFTARRDHGSSWMFELSSHYRGKTTSGYFQIRQIVTGENTLHIPFVVLSADSQ